MREYRIADIIGTARESFSDYGELVALESWERSQLVRLAVNEVTRGIAVVSSEAGLELLKESSIEPMKVEAPPPSIVSLKAPSFFRR